MSPLFQVAFFVLLSRLVSPKVFIMKDWTSWNMTGSFSGFPVSYSGLNLAETLSNGWSQVGIKLLQDARQENVVRSQKLTMMSRLRKCQGRKFWKLRLVWWLLWSTKVPLKKKSKLVLGLFGIPLGKFGLSWVGMKYIKSSRHKSNSDDECSSYFYQLLLKSKYLGNP